MFYGTQDKSVAVHLKNKKISVFFLTIYTPYFALCGGMIGIVIDFPFERVGGWPDLIT